MNKMTCEGRMSLSLSIKSGKQKQYFPEGYDKCKKAQRHNDEDKKVTESSV